MFLKRQRKLANVIVSCTFKRPEDVGWLLLWGARIHPADACWIQFE